MSKRGHSMCAILTRTAEFRQKAIRFLFCVEHEDWDGVGPALDELGAEVELLKKHADGLREGAERKA